jgi:hypothetical protein
MTGTISDRLQISYKSEEKSVLRRFKDLFGLACILSGVASIMGAGVVLAGGYYPLWIQIFNALLVSVLIILYGIYLIGSGRS